ncbi:MAG: sulfatase-like hydrolase/transferase, partial [Candidatus Eremiobacteraeota bacterium]|nr:sulfatase-like hydrolase/transferase [Candidatus Eremiobacteraeota bacterium]
DLNRIETPRDPKYHLMTDLANQAIKWTNFQKALTPDKPFFIYFAPGATHAPHHVPKEWADKYKGKFDQGWDAMREEIFARQKQLGVIPKDAQLTTRPAEIPAWDDMDPKMRPVLAREMEVYAGFLEHTDHNVGRLIDAIDKLGQLDNTLIFYIVGDNGASAEGTINGTFNEMFTLNGVTGVETPEFLTQRVPEFGGPYAYNHYAVGWAHAMDTPYQWTKQVASHWGGTRNGTIVHWPKGFRARGEVRSHFHHVIDIAATVLDAVGLPHPAFVNGIQQMPLHGFSMKHSFDDPRAADRHETQYFEMFVNRGIYHKGWTAVTRHSTPWVMVPQLPPYDDDVWELYGPDDWTQSRNIAKENPDKLRDLQRLFLIEATKYNVLPLDDRRVERFNSDLAGRPTLIKGDSQLLFGSMGRLQENSIVNIKNKSHSVTAQVTVPAGGARGVVIHQGGRFGGWALYVKDGKLSYCYNCFGWKSFTARADSELPEGDHQVRVEFEYDGGGLGKGGNVTLFVDGKKAGSGRVDMTVPMAFSADETCDVGRDTGTPVSDEYTIEGSAFNGKVLGVQIDTGKADADRFITAEERLRIAMARQ